MIKKQQQFLIKGMNQDIAETKVQPGLAHSIKNLRVITDEDSGTLSLVTEKGTNKINLPTSFSLIKNQSSYEAFAGQTAYSTSWSEQQYVNFDTSGSTSIALVCRLRVYSISCSYNFPRNVYANSYSDVNIPKCVMIIGTSPYIKIPASSTTNGYTLELRLNSNDINNIYYTVTKTKNGVSETLSDTFQFDTSDFQFTGVPTISQNHVSYTVPALYLSYAIMSNPQDFSGDINNTYLLNAFKSQVSVLEKAKYLLSFNVKNIIGSCAFKKELIIFAKDSNNFDEIIKYKNIEDGENSEYVILYSGDLNFNINNPIKTYVSYENEKNIKVYWIDGLNQPRVINIADGVTYETRDTNDDNHFNFCTPIYNNETVQIEKKAIGGFFHSGVIQYFMTYVDQNDQESKTFYASPLYYLTDSNRALSPEENSNNSFEIKITNINNNVLLRKRLRIYSLQRTSLDAVPVCKLITEFKLTSSTNDLFIVDTGNIGINVDPQTLLFLGCEEFVPQVFNVKDNTIFFCNIESKNYQTIDESVANEFIINTIDIQNTFKSQVKVATEYNSNFQLNGIVNGTSQIENNNGSDGEIKGFMYNEEYMLGIQFLHKNGEWTEPIWCGDFIMTSAPYSSGDYQFTPYFQATFQHSKFEDLIQDGYIAVRPLVVFNDQQNCRILCQGIINPTIKYENNYYPSWFFRYFNIGYNYGTMSTGFFRKLSFGDGNSVHGEVQGFDSHFIIKNNLLTFNSPEIEFEKITNIPDNTYNFLRIGSTEIHANNYDIEMLTSTSTFNNEDNYGLKAKRGVSWYSSDTKETFIGGFCWMDKDFVETTSTINNCAYYIWPWENNQSYSCAPKSDNDIIYSAPERKIISNYRYSQYFKKGLGNKEYNIEYINLANNSYIRAKPFNDSNNEYAYIKDVDILVTGEVDQANISTSSGNCFRNDYGTSTILSGNTSSGCNIVRIQYKTTPHILLSLDNDSNDNDVFYYDDQSELPNFNYGNLIVGELINKAYSNETKFKGRTSNGKPTSASMYENTWYIAGDIKNFANNSNNVVISWTKGDTYYQRYDCLKTYPYSHEAKNSIVDVLSCMIQTRINLDGRYDKNRCLDILHIDPNNFNKLNDVYSQMDNFFTYRKLDPDRFQNVFPNLIIWSKQKQFGENIDSWTNIHLVNTLDLDGALGKITALKLWNNKLLAFQQKGIALIKYNENSMIPQITGSPIELMNSGKVTGKEYLTNQFGCQNEWSIVNAKSGLYFSDDYNHKLYVLSDGIKCISDELGFKSYLKNKNYSGVWTPNRNAWTEQNGGTLRTYYDQQLGDIYFIDGKDCLTYNEAANLFTSFYDYVDVNNDKRVFDFINIENKNYWILNNFANNGNPLFYEHRAIDNLNIFDNNKGYEVELTANVDPHVDKIFDTIEIRGDAYTPDLNSGYGAALPFDTLQVSNEYQDTNEQSLTFLKDKPYSSGSNMKQKFRIWRAAIGRNQKGEGTRVKRDRIRNYWSRIKLKRTATNNLRAKIHDIIVNVYE